jgi:hypothetical protein
METRQCDGPRLRPQAYAERLMNFFDQALHQQDSQNLKGLSAL